jgi:hypothetical protein
MGFNKRIISREHIIAVYLQQMSIDDVTAYVKNVDCVQLSTDEFVHDVYEYVTTDNQESLLKMLKKYIYNK